MSTSRTDRVTSEGSIERSATVVVPRKYGGVGRLTYWLGLIGLNVLLRSALPLAGDRQVAIFFVLFFLILIFRFACQTTQKYRVKLAGFTLRSLAICELGFHSSLRHTSGGLSGLAEIR